MYSRIACKNNMEAIYAFLSNGAVVSRILLNNPIADKFYTIVDILSAIDVCREVRYKITVK